MDLEDFRAIINNQNLSFYNNLDTENDIEQQNDNILDLDFSLPHAIDCSYHVENSMANKLSGCLNPLFMNFE